MQLAQDLVDELYQITITCAEEGKLAQQAHGDERNLLLLQPKETNDAGFAMTSSFTSMLLTALLVFDPSEEEIKEKRVAELVHLSEQILEKDRAVKEVVDLDFERVIYLGAGPFFGLAHEAQLKILELTAGKIATMYESPVGFRHGPKSSSMIRPSSWSLDPLILIPDSMIWTWFEKLQGIKLPVRSFSWLIKLRDRALTGKCWWKHQRDSLDIYRAFHPHYLCSIDFSFDFAQVKIVETHPHRQ